MITSQAFKRHVCSAKGEITSFVTYDSIGDRIFTKRLQKSLKKSANKLVMFLTQLSCFSRSKQFFKKSEEETEANVEKRRNSKRR